MVTPRPAAPFCALAWQTSAILWSVTAFSSAAATFGKGARLVAVTRPSWASAGEAARAAVKTTAATSLTIMDHPLSLSGERHVALEDDEGGAARDSLRLPNLRRARAGGGGGARGREAPR